MCLIVISGKARVGKDTFAEMLAKELNKRTGNAYVLMAYANELKNRIQKDFDMSFSQLWGDEKEFFDDRYPKLVGHYASVHEDYIQTHWTPREVMQKYGEFFRSIDKDFWVRCLFNIVDDREYKNVIITDGRHPNEIDPVVDRCGYHIRINRPDANKVHGMTHISEIGLDQPYKIDFTVMNTGTLNDLKKLASDIANGITQLEKFRR